MKEIGKRLRQARLIAGKTQEKVVADLSELGVQLTKAGLSKYERGGSSPPASLLVPLGRVLSVPSDFFLVEPTTTVEWKAFRKLSRLRKTQQDRVKALAQRVVERQVWLQEKLYPQTRVSLPKVTVTTGEQAEEAAAKVRKRWRLGDAPLESVTRTLEDNNCIVVEFPGQDGFHGLSGWANDVYPVTVTSRDVLADRRRFNLAHEIGHLVMRCNGVDEKQEELLAHRFAAALLVPQKVVFNELGQHRHHLSMQELALLKKKHGLSMQAWLFRALDLGVITPGHFKALFRQFSSRGWRKQEPAEYVGDETPIRLRQLTHRALSEGVISADEAEEILPGCTQEEQIMQRPLGYISAQDVLKLSVKDRDELMARSAALAEQEYRDNKGLTDFEAFGVEDLCDDMPPSDD
jgi:Zn-dependent peptidase ImmA (M78 family)/transcriptional regulator with XRE-family HTH domain